MAFLENEQLKLRALEPSDIDDIYRWENDTEIWSVSNTVAPFSRQIIIEYLRDYKADIFSQRQLRLMIMEKQSHASVGMIDLYNFDPFNSRVHLGIIIDTNFRKKGYGQSATKLIIDYCRNFLKIHQIIIETPQSNPNSMKLFEAVGFTPCGVLKDWLKTPNGYDDLNVYQLVF